MGNIKRCNWAVGEMMIYYHDNEWGKEVHDDYVLFEFLVLEGAQAGLSWATILKRRDSYKEIFYNFDFNKIANLNDAELELILLDERIIRNRLKVYSVRNNAQKFIEVVNEFGSFDKYIWAFTKNEIIKNYPIVQKDVVVNSPLSDSISKDLKKRGFKFVGSTIIYSYLQAIGVINDHLIDCTYRYK